MLKNSYDSQLAGRICCILVKIFRNCDSSSIMTMWADNIKFVKDIIDSKYSKIDHAVAEVGREDVLVISDHFKIAESSEALLKDANCAKSKEHFRFGLRTLELVQTLEIEKLLETIISVSSVFYPKFV